MTKKKHEPTGDYDVGYCRPPEASRFKKGQEPPRRKPTEKQATDIASLLDAPVAVISGGKKEKVPPYEAMLLSMVKAALEGKTSALQYLFRQFDKYELLKRAEKRHWNPTILVPIEMPIEMGSMLYWQFGRQPWTDEKIELVRRHYLQSRTPEQMESDEREDYDYLKEPPWASRR
jgi:hypothetical protein